MGKGACHQAQQLKFESPDRLLSERSDFHMLSSDLHTWPRTACPP